VITTRHYTNPRLPYLTLPAKNVKKRRQSNSTRTAQIFANANLIRIRSPYPDYRFRGLPELNGDLLAQSYICGKIFMNILLVFQEIRVKLWKNAQYRSVEREAPLPRRAQRVRRA